MVDEGQVLAVVDSPELSSRLKQEQSIHLSLQSDLERQRILAPAGPCSPTARRSTLRWWSWRRRHAPWDGPSDHAARASSTTSNTRRRRTTSAGPKVKLTHARENAELESDTLDFEIRSRELLLERQRLVVEELQRQVDRPAVRSPVGGLVSRFDVDDHDAVAPGQPLVAVVDLSAFEIEVLVPEAYADEITPGTPAGCLSLGSRNSPAPCAASRRRSRAARSRGIVVFSADPPEGLRQNQRVSTRLVLDSRPGVLKAPRGPFLEAGRRQPGLCHRGRCGRAAPRSASAPSSISDVEIVSGLEVGDRIIISDITRFREAERVFLRD